MTDKQKRFCEEYVKDWNATRAAIAAGYSEKTAYSIASENLTKPYIREEIERLNPIHAKYRLVVNKQKSISKNGFIYLIKCGDFNLYKIGKANSSQLVLSRLNQCQTGNPFKLILSGYWEVSNYHLIEKRLHSLFNNKHKRGEWFELNENDLLLINDFMNKKSIVKPLKTLFNG
jgi:hypothetical protein